MLGFALSPDGADLAYGGQDDGVLVGPSGGGAGFVHVSTMKNRGLTWHDAGLYASASDPIDPFAVGLSTDRGRSFEAIYNLRNTCPQACPDDSPLSQTCRATWIDPVSGVARLTNSSGRTCAVSWAGVAGPGDGGVDAEVVRADAGPGERPTRADDGCACQSSGGTALPWFGVSIGATLLALASVRRRRGSRRRDRSCQ